MATALITGATAGIGKSFARLLAAQGYDLVLVARDEARLRGVADELAAKYNIHAEPFRADLSRYDECAWVEQRLADPARPIEVLINNAGYTVNQDFVDGSLPAEQAMFDVLTRAVLRLSHAAAVGMKARGSGSIINVSSVAGWIPQSTYGAAKSFVTSFSRALRRDLRKSGVKVMALCPGYTATEFHERADYAMGRVPKFMVLNADALVATAWDDLQHGRAVSIPGAMYKISRFLLRFAY